LEILDKRDLSGRFFSFLKKMLSIICNVDFNEKDNFSQTQNYSNLLKNNHFDIVSNDEFFHKFIAHLKSSTNNLDLDEEMFSIKSSEFVKSYLIDKPHADTSLITLAISCLQSFVQLNWIGPLPIQTSNLPINIIEKSLSENSSSNRAFNLIDHFKPNSEVEQEHLF
jgi:hypothetical protein